TEQEVNDFTGFFEELKAIPNIKSLHYGPPAKTHQRDVVDNSFSYNLLVYFDTMEDIDTYENHPIHLAAIDKYSKNRSEEHTSELQSRENLVCRLLLEKKKKI